MKLSRIQIRRLIETVVNEELELDTQDIKGSSKSDHIKKMLKNKEAYRKAINADKIDFEVAKAALIIYDDLGDPLEIGEKLIRDKKFVDQAKNSPKILVRQIFTQLVKGGHISEAEHFVERVKKNTEKD